MNDENWQPKEWPSWFYYILAVCAVLTTLAILFLPGGDSCHA